MLFQPEFITLRPLTQHELAVAAAEAVKEKNISPDFESQPDDPRSPQDVDSRSIVGEQDYK